MTDLNAALVEQFLHISVAEWKAVAVGLGVGHGGSAYPIPVKATQPVELLGVLPVEYETAAVLVQARVQDALRVMRTHRKELQTWPTVQKKLRELG